MRNILAAGFLALTVLIGGTTQATAKTLTIGITQYPSTFHPGIDPMMAKSYILAMTRRPITTFNPDWELICMLCTGLPTIENGEAVPETTPDGAEGIAITYKLDPEAKWGDGTPLTANDVKFAWEVGRSNVSGVGNAELYRSAWKFDVLDDQTFRVHFDKLTFRYNAINDLQPLPAHLDRAIFEASPEDYKNRTAYDTDTTNPGLYYGPYVISSTARGSQVELERNPNWWGKAPAFDRIIIKVVENTAALEANLLSGGLDMIAGELGLTLDQALAFEKRHGDRFDVTYNAGLIYEHIDFNLDNPILADKRVRHALILGLDRDTISQRLFDGKQPVAHSSVSPLDTVADPEVLKYPFDLARANALLDEAGWTERKQGIRHNAAGEALRLDFMTTAGNRSRELVQQVLQSQWKALGVDVVIKNEPARVFFGKTIRERIFTGMVMYAWISAPESVPRTTLHSESIPTAANGWAGQNNPGYISADMDRLIEAIEVELDFDTRKGLWSELQNLYASDLPVLPLYYRANAFVTPKGMTGLVPTGHQYPTSLWVEDWQLP